MLPKWHILLGFVFSYVLIYFFNFSLFAGTIVFLSSFLIDFDHYLYFVYKKKDLSYFQARGYYSELNAHWKNLSKEEKESYKYPIMIFHGIEFWIILALLGFISPIFFWILMGIGVHMIADLSEYTVIKEPIYAKLSQGYTYMVNKSKNCLE